MTELEEAELRHRRRQLGWCRPAADEILSMVQLEENTRNHQLQVEREAQERRQQLEQARIDRLLDEAPSLRRAMDIRAYVDAVKNIVASKTNSISSDAIDRWSKWRSRKPIASIP